MKSKTREERLNEVKEKRYKASKSLTTYKNSHLPVSATAEYITFIASSYVTQESLRYCERKFDFLSYWVWI